MSEVAGTRKQRPLVVARRTAPGGAKTRAPRSARPRPSAAGPRRAALLLFAVTAVVFVVGFALSGDVQLRVESRLYPLRYADEIGAAAARHGVDPYLVAAVARAESGYDPVVVSRAGAVGLMQIMPATAAWIGEQKDWGGGPVLDLTDPVLNLELGAFYLAFLIDRFDGDVTSALAAYNAGQGTVATWLADGAGGRSSLQPADIPFPETRGFVERAERFLEIYRRVHPDAFLS